MQIHDLNEFVGALGANVFLPVDNGQDTGKLAFTDLFAANSFETLWTGEARGTSDEIEFEKPITDFDFIDIYYGRYHVPRGDGKVERSLKYLRIPTANFPDILNLEASSCEGIPDSNALLYDFVTTVEKTNNTKLTITGYREFFWGGEADLDAETISNPMISIYRIDGIKTPGNTKGVVAVRTITLAAADWESYSQTVEVEDVTANNSVLVCAAPGSQTDAMTYGVNCVSQGADELTFACQSTPSSDITIYVMIVG